MHFDPDPPLPPPQSGTRRRLTLLYTDLSGSTVLGAAIEPEHYRALLQSLRQVWHSVADVHHGRVVLTQGDGALLAFGLPLAGEQDGRHAADAALAVHARVAALQPPGVPAQLLPLRMHSAIHAGNVLLDAGDIEHGVFDLSGDVLNTTAHLARQAQPGQVLTTLPTLGPHALFFKLGDAAPEGVALLDPALTRQVRVVLGRGQAMHRFDATAQRGLTPFIGRAAVLAQLQAFVQFVQRPTTTPQRCLVLQGAAGLGKTRLLEQLLCATDLSGYCVLRGSCDNDLGAEVLQPFVQMLRAWVQQHAAAGALAPPLSPALADSAAALQSLLDARSPMAAAPDSASGVVGLLQQFFTALANDSARCVLVIDDWQWADDASRQLLQALSAQPNGPALLLASRPREAAVDWVAGAPHLRLDAFTPEETAVAVQRLLARPDPFLVARIHDYAGGVPLFIEELCHTVSVDHLLRAIDSRGAAQSWLATLVVGRLERLPSDQAELVRAAAVVGNVVPLRWLAVACGHAPEPLLLQALVDADFLRVDLQGEVLRFKHGITRDAVYDSIGLQQRMALHQRMQAALAAEASADGATESLEALAYHSVCAGSWALATQHAEQAGDKAMAVFALDRARRQYLAAMQALDKLGPLHGDAAKRWCLLANKLGMTCIFDTLALPDALALFQRAVVLAEQTGDLAVQARAHYWMGYMLYGHGLPRPADRHCRQGMALATQAGDHRLVAQLRATLGQVLVALCQYDEALALMGDALASKQRQMRQGSSLAVGSAFTLACQGSVLGDRGQFDLAQAAFVEASRLVGDSAHPVANSVRSWSVMVLLWQGRWDDALAVADESVWLAQRAAALLPMAIARAAGGYALWRGQGLQRGFVQIEEAVQWMEQRRVQFYTSIYYGWLVEGLVEQQRGAQARRHGARLLGRARAGELLGLGTGSRALALACGADHRERGDGGNTHAWRHLARAEAAALQRGSAREQALNLQCRAQLLAAQQQLPQALVAARAAGAAFADMGMLWHAQAVSAWIDRQAW